MDARWREFTGAVPAVISIRPPRRARGHPMGDRHIVLCVSLIWRCRVSPALGHEVSVSPLLILSPEGQLWVLVKTGRRISSKITYGTTAPTLRTLTSSSRLTTDFRRA